MGDPKPVTAADVERLKQRLSDMLRLHSGHVTSAGAVGMLVHMVRSVLELHKPFCDGFEWPCPTVETLVRCLPEEE